MLAGMGPLLGEGERADASGEPVHLHPGASDITEQLSKETGGHARNNRWSWVQGMWAFHFQEKRYSLQSQPTAQGKTLESVHRQSLLLLRQHPRASPPACGSPTGSKPHP